MQPMMSMPPGSFSNMPAMPMGTTMGGPAPMGSMGNIPRTMGPGAAGPMTMAGPPGSMMASMPPAGVFPGGSAAYMPPANATPPGSVNYAGGPGMMPTQSMQMPPASMGMPPPSIPMGGKAGAGAPLSMQGQYMPNVSRPMMAGVANPPVVAGNVQYGPSYKMQYQRRSTADKTAVKYTGFLPLEGVYEEDTCRIG